MKKSIIWLLVAVMSVAFVGLLYVQITYMDNMVKMRNEQFSEAVMRSLYAVSKTAEQEETRRYLAEDMEEQQKQMLSPQRNGNVITTTQSQQYARVNPDGSFSNFSFQEKTTRTMSVDPALSLKTQKNKGTISATSMEMQELLKGQYLYQKALLDEVIISILRRASNRPIMTRIDKTKLEQSIENELQNNGLDLPFQFAILDKSDNHVFSSEGYASDHQKETYSQTLFPNDPPDKLYYLSVYFPTKKNYIFSSVRFMIPSFIFTFFLLITFLFTIAIAFRQKKLTEMKNDFINNMTHEFKTPISSISLAAQMLQDDAVSKNPTVFRHISGVINDETKRLQFQVEKVLQMSMFDRQKTMLKLVELNVNELVSGVVATFKLKVEKYGGSIDTLLEAKQDMVWLDEMHFTNVVFNLLDNAVKYRREEVDLHLTVSTKNEGNRLVLTIQDNGIGIKREDLKKIFDKFYRVSTGNLHNVKGFGLGLSYVAKIVKDLKGTIKAESDLSIGTKFIITLPLIKNS